MIYIRKEHIPNSIKWRISLLKFTEKMMPYWTPIKKMCLAVLDKKPDIKEFSFETKPVYIEGNPVILRWEVKGAYRLELSGVGDVTSRSLAIINHDQDQLIFTLTAYGANNIVQRCEITLPIPERIVLNSSQTKPSDIQYLSAKIEPLNIIRVNSTDQRCHVKNQLPVIRELNTSFKDLNFLEPNYQSLFNPDTWNKLLNDVRETYSYPKAAEYTASEPVSVIHPPKP